MANPAPMPRWYDFPIVSIGGQLLVWIASSAIVRWVLPDLYGTAEAAIPGGLLVAVSIASYRLQRRLRARDEAARRQI